LNDGRTFISGGGDKSIHIWGVENNTNNKTEENNWDDLSTNYVNTNGN